MLTDVPRYLSVILLARVAAEISAAVLVTAVLVTWLGVTWKAFLITAAAMTVASYILAGLVPRSIGRHYPVKVAIAAASVLRPVIRLLGPLPRLLAAAGAALSPGQDRRDRDGHSGSEEDLRGLVDLLEQRQIIEPGERAMIHSVFELGDTIVREVMVPRTDMAFIERAKTLGQGLSLALRSGFSRIPVIGENLDDVVGIAYLKDIMTRIHEHPEGESVETVESIMRPATFAPESKPVDDLLREMQARHVHMAIVIDEYGGTAGLVTIEDILEEIVGEIADEYDRERPPVEWLSDGRGAGQRPAVGGGARGALRRQHRRRRRGDRRRPARAPPGQGAHRRLGRDGIWPAADRREPGWPAQPHRHGDGAAHQRGGAAGSGWRYRARHHRRDGRRERRRPQPAAAGLVSAV